MRKFGFVEYLRNQTWSPAAIGCVDSPRRTHDSSNRVGNGSMARECIDVEQVCFRSPIYEKLVLLHGLLKFALLPHFVAPFFAVHDMTSVADAFRCKVVVNQSPNKRTDTRVFTRSGSTTDKENHPRPIHSLQSNTTPSYKHCPGIEIFI